VSNPEPTMPAIEACEGCRADLRNLRIPGVRFVAFDIRQGDAEFIVRSWNGYAAARMELQAAEMVADQMSRSNERKQAAIEKQQAAIAELAAALQRLMRDAGAAVNLLHNLKAKLGPEMDERIASLVDAATAAGDQARAAIAAAERI
jgi:ElaB/YqjD/DUF883 family membrane-anchored ribosome-binding protein